MCVWGGEDARLVVVDVVDDVVDVDVVVVVVVVAPAAAAAAVTVLLLFSVFLSIYAFMT